MARKDFKKKRLIVPGAWRATNLTPSPHAIEFSWITFPAGARGPNNITLPAVALFMAPAEAVVQKHPGSIVQNGIMLMIDFVVSRSWFSDLLLKVENDRLKLVSFTVEAGDGNNWPVSLWSIELGRQQKGT